MNSGSAIFIGSVVRVAPNELSFNSAQSWKDIYGQRKGHKVFIKSAFYDGGNFANQAHSIVSERDPGKHGQMRKYLSNAFSDRALKEQEFIVSGVIDKFIAKVESLGSVAEGIDMTMWFNLMTFDVIGELAFGKTFGGLDSGIMTITKEKPKNSFNVDRGLTLLGIYCTGEHGTS